MHLRPVLSIVGFVVLAAAGCGSATDNRPAKWSYIAPVIIEPNCATANCHSELANRGNIRLDTVAKSYKALQGFAAGSDPEKSFLITLLRGTNTTFQRMPPSYPLADADISLIAEWAGAGAQWDGPGAQP